MSWIPRVDMKSVFLNCAIYVNVLVIFSCTEAAAPRTSTFATTILQIKQTPRILGNATESSIRYTETKKENGAEVITVKAVPKIGTKRENKGILIEDINGDVDTFFPVDDEDEPLPEFEDDEEDRDVNSTERGQYLGSSCEFTCNPKLHHVFCDPISGHCECEKKYPVKIGYNKGCAKPKKLGEQCFYRQTCKYADAHSNCVQINHNAICQCENGYHSVSYARPVKKVFCTEDLALLAADVPTLLGVTTGIAVLAGLLCMVLHLYTRARHPHHPHLADASLSPPIMFTSETGIPMALHGTRPSTRPSSRSSQRSSGTCGSDGTAGTMDSSCPARRTQARGVPVSASRAGAARAAAILLISCHLKARQERAAARAAAAAAKNPAAGSRRPSLASVQSSSSSVRSYSARRFEREREQKERRQQMQMRLARLHASMAPPALDRPALDRPALDRPALDRPALDRPQRPQPTPSPSSTDGLLMPALNEATELSMSRSMAMAMNECSSSSLQGIVGPCSSAGTSY